MRRKEGRVTQVKQSRACKDRWVEKRGVKVAVEMLPQVCRDHWTERKAAEENPVKTSRENRSVVWGVPGRSHRRMASYPRSGAKCSSAAR
jgi:hypothetical protein